MIREGKLSRTDGTTYDGLENIEKPSPALEVTLSSSTDTNCTSMFEATLFPERGSLYSPKESGSIKTKLYIES